MHRSGSRLARVFKSTGELPTGSALRPLRTRLAAIATDTIRRRSPWPLDSNGEYSHAAISVFVFVALYLATLSALSLH
ncbi:hypothetical protein AM571_PC00959 (plasmid) [Rhizobium etli 8C-3]|nr:hypothetical protein AM571_PC00959 [Rhizobium etli 8C-3]